MNTHGALVLTAPAKQVAQRKVEFRCVGVTLDGLNEGVYGLVLLLVEQKIQALEIGLGRTPVLQAHLAQVKPGCEPAQHKSHRQAQQYPAEVKVHAQVASQAGFPGAQSHALSFD